MSYHIETVTGVRIDGREFSKLHLPSTLDVSTGVGTVTLTGDHAGRYWCDAGFGKRYVLAKAVETRKPRQTVIFL